MQILRHYPFSILTILAIWYLSFFTPPHTQLEEINNFDKLVHVCMYGGLSSIIWIEHLIRHKQIKKIQLTIGGILLPILMSGIIEILQSQCTDNRSGDWMDFIANCTGILCIFGRLLHLSSIYQKKVTQFTLISFPTP